MRGQAEGTRRAHWLGLCISITFLTWGHSAGCEVVASTHIPKFGCSNLVESVNIFHGPKGIDSRIPGPQNSLLLWISRPYIDGHCSGVGGRHYVNSHSEIIWRTVEDGVSLWGKPCYIRPHPKSYILCRSLSKISDGELNFTTIWKSDIHNLRAANQDISPQLPYSGILRATNQLSRGPKERSSSGSQHDGCDKQPGSKKSQVSSQINEPPIKVRFLLAFASSSASVSVFWVERC